MNENNNLKYGLATIIIISIAFTRLIPHIPNATSMLALTIFGGYVFDKFSFKLFVPVVALFLSDLVINNTIYAAYYEGFTWYTSGILFTVGAFAAIIAVQSNFFQKLTLKSGLSMAFISSILFFIISNFGAWSVGLLYPKTIVGLIACYTAAIPFFLNTLLGTLVYGGILYGIWNFALPKSIVTPIKVKSE